MLSYFWLLNLGNNVSAWRSRTVFKLSIYITSLCVPLWSNHLSWVRIRCKTNPQLWSQLRVCYVFFISETAVLHGVFGIWVKCWCLKALSWLWFAPYVFRRCEGAAGGGKEEKLDACRFDSVLCKMATLLCLIALCRVMIVSEMLSFIKWVWASVYKKSICVTGSIFKAYRQ